MNKKMRSICESDLLVVEHEGTLESKLPVILCKHASKHMSFSTPRYGTKEVIERDDGIGYDPNTGTFYQSDKFRM